MKPAPHRVLVVDDEESIRDLLSSTLTDAGIEVLDAASAEEALRLFEAGEMFDLVLTDLRMPGLSGEELVTQLSREYPDVALVIMTGFPSFESAKTALKAKVNDYLEKPFDDLNTVRERILEILDHRQRGLSNASLLRELGAKNEELEIQKNLLARKVSATQRNLREQVHSLQKTREVFLTDLSRVMAILDSLADGILFTDTQGKVIFANPSAAEMLGFLPFAAMGRPVSEIEGNRTLLSLLAAQRTMELDDAGAQADMSLIDGDGGEVHYSVHTSSVRDVQGALSGTLTLVRDVSLRRKTEHLKNQFLSIVAHELRTPLTAIKAFATILDKGIYGELSEQQQPVVENIVSQSDRLGHEIDKIINMGRLEAEDFAPDSQVVSVTKILSKLLSPFQSNAEDEGLALRLIDESDEAKVNADVHDIRRALRALIENALKFTPAGGSVEIRISSLDTEVMFEVEDTGIGIAPQDQSVIFEKFTQLENPLTREHGGCGLGLSFAAEILKSHGSKIEVESVLGKGATFRFRLPRVDEGERESTTASDGGVVVVAEPRRNSQ